MIQVKPIYEIKFVNLMSCYRNDLKSYQQFVKIKWSHTQVLNSCRKNILSRSPIEGCLQMRFCIFTKISQRHVEL